MGRSNLDGKIDLFFFDWKADREAYSAKYIEIAPDRFSNEGGLVRYSPMYLLLGDIAHCYGTSLSSRDEALFAGVILCRLAISNLATMLYGKKREIEFVQNYLAPLTNLEAFALNELRNALEHSFYGLSSRLGRNKVDPQNPDIVKYYFTMTQDSPSVILESEAWDRPDSRMFIVNVRRIYSSLLKAINGVRKDLENNSDRAMTQKFIDEFNFDTWVGIKS